MLSKELREITSTVAAKSACTICFQDRKRYKHETGITSWKLTVKKIGKGTGKNAPALKRQARE
jgi:hypothetical protein